MCRPFTCARTLHATQKLSLLLPVELFADTADVSMCEVACRCRSGQATSRHLNFPDRTALAAEVLNEHVARIEQLAVECEGDPDAFFVLLRWLVEGVVDLYALGELARADACVGSELERSRLRIAELIKEPLSRAKTEGTLRNVAALEDVFLVLLMTRGALERAQGAGVRAAAANRVLTLALDGLVPPGARA